MKLLRRCYSCRRMRLTYWEAECEPTVNSSKKIQTSLHAIWMRRRAKGYPAAE